MKSSFGWMCLVINIACGLVPCFVPKVTADDEVEKSRIVLLETFIQELVEITPGEGKFPKSFRMGSSEGPTSERPVHEVTFTRPFAIAKYEVPQNLYAAVMGNNPSKWKGVRNSAEMMTSTDALTFCDKLTQELRTRKLIPKDELIRLPSEAEWEYCCRAGTDTAYSFGEMAQAAGDDVKQNQASILDRYGWHTGNAAGNDPPVGALKPNAWGLYDMHGYLWEFTLDAWQTNYEQSQADGSPQRTKTENDSSGEVTIRGGSWKDRFPELRSASRKKFPRDHADDAVGFRCVKARHE